MNLTTKKLSLDERQEFDDRNQRIRDHAYGVGVELLAIRDKKLFREDYETFDDFLNKHHGVTRSYAYRMLRSAERPLSIELSNEKRAIVVENSQGVPTNETATPTSVNSEHHTIEVGQTPEEPKPLADFLHPSTSPLIPLMRDKTGYPIPEHLHQFFRRGGEISSILENLSKVRGTIRRFQDAREQGREDIIFARTDLNGIKTNLDQAYDMINVAIPFAVCPDCQGHNSNCCMSCKGMGMISFHHWDSCIPIEAKNLRAMSIPK